MGKRVLVCGGRDFDDWSLVLYAMAQLKINLSQSHDSDITIIQGGAKGADFLARVYAKWVGFSVEEYPADWGKHGKAAGYIRNKKMLEEGKPDLVLAFPGGRGTADMVRQAKEAGVEVLEVA